MLLFFCVPPKSMEREAHENFARECKKCAQFTFLTFAMYPKRNPMNRTGNPPVPLACAGCQRGFCAAVTTNKHTHTHTKNNNNNSRTLPISYLILYACPQSSSPSLSVSLSLSHSLFLSYFLLCDVMSVELTYTWGFCETMFLNQIKIRNEHFTRHCICFAVNFTFSECPVLRLEHFEGLQLTQTHTHTNTHT